MALSNKVVVPPSGKASFAKIADILKTGVWEFPENGRYNGSGAPGRLLEDLLGIKENNADSPDLADWEIKFHGGSSLLTLFHKDPEPRGAIKHVVNDYGYEDDLGRWSFRHTISSKSSRGFHIQNENGRIVIKNDQQQGIEPYWMHNTLLNALSAKLRRLIVVHGEVKANPRRVIFESAIAYWEPDIAGFVDAVVKGTFCVDFDARTKGPRGTAIRNHGTKFRIDIKNLGNVYANSLQIAL